MKPEDLQFLAVGPFKTGTTWIDAYLRKHPGVCLPQRVKETFFFDRYFDRGFDWYATHFEGLDAGQAAGEVGPSYFQSGAVTERVFSTNPACRILVTMREPVSRTVSHYLMMVRNGVVARDASIRDAIVERGVLLESSRYHKHLERWTKQFGQELVTAILFDSLKRDVADFSQRVCDALVIDAIPVPEELTGRVHGRQEPVSYGLSKLTARMTAFLRRHQWHGLVNLAKRVGAKDMIYTSNRSELSPAPGDLQFVFDRLVDDALALESDFDIDISDWKRAWKQDGLAW
jgi:hypothetical protein